MKKVLKWAGYLCLSFIILMTAVLLKWESISYYAIRKAAQYYAGKADIVLDIGRISGSPFSQTTAEDLSVRPAAGEPQTFNFKAQAISCTYDLWELRENFQTFLQGLQCSADTPDFTYDLKAVTSGKKPQGKSAKFLLPEILPALELSNGAILLEHEAWNIEASGLHANLQSVSGIHELQLETEALRFNQDGKTRIDTGVVSLLRYKEGKLTIDSLELGKEDVSATGEVDLSKLDKNQLSFATDMAVAGNRLKANGVLEGQTVTLQVGTDRFDIEELQKRLGGAGWDVAGKLKAEAEMTFNRESGAGPVGFFDIEIMEGQLQGVAVEMLTAKGRLEKGRLYLDNAQAMALGFSLMIDRATIPLLFTGKERSAVSPELNARIESGNIAQLAGLAGDLQLTGQVSADISVSGSTREPKAHINLDADHLSYRDKAFGRLSLLADVEIHQEKPGNIQSLGFAITKLNLDNGAGILSLLFPVTGSWQPGTFALNGAFQLDGKSEISAGMSREAGKEITVNITTRNLESEGWLAHYIDSRYFFKGADIEAVLQGIYENTQLQLSGTVREAGATDVPFPLNGSFALHYSPKGIEIKEFTWTSLERNQLTVTGFLPYDPMAVEPFLEDALTLKGHIDFPSLEDVAVFLEPWGIGKGSVAFDIDLTGSWQQPQGHVLVDIQDLEPPERIRSYIESPVDIVVDLDARGNDIVLKSANLDSVQYAVRATGSWQHGVSFKEFLRNQKAELQGDVSADVIVQLKDLNFLRRKLTWLRRLEGDMQGELHLAGPVAKPSMNGTFSFKDGEISHTFNFPMLSGVSLQGEFDMNSITISDMRAEVGGSPVNLQGSVKREQEAVGVNLHVDGKNVLLFRNNDMRLRGDVQLDVSGPLERLVINGTTGLTGGYFTKNFDFLGMIGGSSAPVSEGVSFLFSFPDPPLKDAVLDIKITTIEPFRIRNNLVRGALRPEVTLKGTGELPYLLGTVYIDPARVLLPSGRLQVQSGLLRFLEGQPDRPQLDLLAQSKLLGYDINVITQGPIDDPVVTLSSSPALSNDDLLLLLLTGQPPKEDIAGGAQSRGTTNVMVYLGRDFLNRWLEDETGTSDETILDRFELDFGRDVTKSGEQTIESTFRLSEYTSGTGKIYYLAGEKDKYDAYNYGLRLVFRFE